MARIISKKSFCACDTADIERNFPARSKITLKDCNCFVTPGLGKGKKGDPNPFDTKEFEIFFD